MPIAAARLIPRRKDTTTEVFRDFVTACRNALARLEAGQVIL